MDRFESELENARAITEAGRRARTFEDKVDHINRWGWPWWIDVTPELLAATHPWQHPKRFPVTEAALAEAEAREARQKATASNAEDGQ